MVQRKGVRGRRNARGKNNLTARPKGISPTVNVTMRMEVPLKQEIERIAREEHRSLSNALLMLLYEALEGRQKRAGVLSKGKK